MVKATAPLTPRQVLGNRRRSLSLEEASAALVAMLSGVRKVTRLMMDFFTTDPTTQNWFAPKG